MQPVTRGQGAGGLDTGHVGHTHRHPGQWGGTRSCHTEKGLSCLAVAFILQQQNTVADF